MTIWFMNSRAPWTPQEDMLLSQAMEHSEDSPERLAMYTLRSPTACDNRWRLLQLIGNPSIPAQTEGFPQTPVVNLTRFDMVVVDIESMSCQSISPPQPQVSIVLQEEQEEEETTDPASIPRDEGWFQWDWHIFAELRGEDDGFAFFPYY
jgi:hypothetical protein